ncbi:dipeptidyl carboxypeptidase II [Bacteroidia bacterium]|nr:dipeptidyl carboxypeptidase II [Bacteroidia bacterium]
MFMFACEKNPLLVEKWDTPYEIPPFDQIKTKHFKPAILEGMKLQKEEIQAIIDNPDAPTFENTILAMENSGHILNRAYYIFSAFTSSDCTEEIATLEEELSPLLAKHADEISMNEALFAKVKTVYNDEYNQLQGEDRVLLKKKYDGFVRGGALLNAEEKAKLSEINAELASLATKYGNNVLAELNAFEFVVENADELAGLPQDMIENAATAAKEKGKTGYLFTCDRTVYEPFMTYCANRELREKMFYGYTHKADNNNENDNKAIVAKTASLSYQKAQLLGFNTAADYILDDCMAKNGKTVFDFLATIWNPTLKAVKKEAAEREDMLKKDVSGAKLMPYDWWYYSEKVRQEKYAFDEQSVSEYLIFDNVMQGAFDVAGKLYGITFEKIDIPLYSPEASGYLVKDAEGKNLSIFYTDPFTRSTKRGGAWMSVFREEKGYPKNRVMPIVFNVCNYTKGTNGKPALLSLDEAETVFHEFGHALHGMLTKVKYESLAGTNVKRDFVELPSQIMENWCFAPEVMKLYAKHYKTGEVIPDEMIAKIQNVSKFNQGFTTCELTAAALLDMFWYSLETSDLQDVNAFENDVLKKINMTPYIVPRYRSTYFTHVFGGGYSAGYYGYLWAEVLDSDAFAAFEESGNLFNPELAKKFKENILEKGGTEDPSVLYRNFRGKDANPEYLLKKRGLK